MKKALLAICLAFGLLHAEDEAAKVVYNLTTKDIKNFELRILSATVANKTYYESKLKELEVAVIIHGGAYRFFLKEPAKSEYKNDKALLTSHQTLAKRIASLANTYDVAFYMCNVGMKKHHIEKKDIYDFVQVVPNATIGLIDKQNAGYAYVPVGD